MIKKILLTFIVATLTTALFAQIYNPVKWNQELKVTGKNTANIHIRATIDEGWHLYGLHIPADGPRATAITFKTIQNAKLVGELDSPSKLQKAYDANFDMELNWYINEALFVQKIKFDDVSKVKISGVIEFMVCDDKSCLPPSKQTFTLGAPVVKQSPVVAKDSVVSKPVVTSVKADYWIPVINELKAFGKSSGDAGQTSLWLIFLAGLLGGFLALFTPCVWPIIPMTVSFFLKRSENKKLGQRDAILYGLAIIFIYVILGILITLIFGASALNSLSTNAIFNLIFFALLVVFAVSFFGAFEITLPSSWSTKLDAKADSTAGIISILFMALYHFPAPDPLSEPY